MSSKTHNTMYEEYEEKLWRLERERDQLRAALDNMTEVARLAQEAAATAETRAVTRCAEIAVEKTKYLSCCSMFGHGIPDAIREEYGL